MIFSRSSLLLGTLCALGLASPLRSSNTAPTVHLPDSDVWFTGTTVNSTESFLNIRFGEDTSGNNRFAPPKPYAYPSGSVVNATQSGAACPQQKQPLPDFPLFDNVTKISEDCLTLRVDRPAHTSASDKLPVLVFIFGGGDTIGQIYDSAYDPKLLVAGAAQKDVPVIYVAMNYRVGVFGFASSPALNESDSLNAGLLDQRLALWWIQDHIAAFGGDPDQVTIFGESDGATGVGLQMTAYGGQVAKVPFRRAIMESGAASGDSGTAFDESGQHTAVLIDRINCTASTSQEELECLRRLPMLTLLNTAYAYELTLNSMGGMDVFKPVSPSSFIPDRPTQLLKSGRFARDIDLISGWCENDGAFFTSTDLKTSADVAENLRESYPRLSNASIAKALQLYPLSDFSNDTTVDPPVSAQYFRASQMERDHGFTCPSLLAVETNAQYASHGHVRNYLYSLNQTAFAEVFALEGLTYYGVPHFSDIPYIFNTVTDGLLAPVSTASDRQLASAIGASWASFATFGDPSHANGTVSGWSQAWSSSNSTSAAPKLRVLGGPDSRFTGGRGYHEKLVQRCAFWNSDEVTAAFGV
ncbi:carboxylesterase [Aspergillus sclerotioniger CBS 115572]|uniref:Carboxylesterase n=1 Tax=Aspergillus sclerotioniger CBS 115572 TaxID=1450535 RepID=A0A317VRQ7_9EURO|nr:carboxylesterase [Aspergillus sclerotioniger CBS 115572]PWY75981.1 carboxylesterase [Aspergillus sclerotioniger CBS 115572]